MENPHVAVTSTASTPEQVLAQTPDDVRASLLSVLRHRSRRGMNLVEIMIVVAIIVILIAVLSAGAFVAYGQFQLSQARMQISQIATALDSKMFMGGNKLPSSLDEMKCAEGQSARMDGCLSSTSLTDPWGHEFIYEVPGPGNYPYDVVCLGSDGAEGGTGSAADIRYSEMQ